MHIPDGFLDSKTAATTGALALAGLGMALRQTRLHFPPRRVPLLGMSAAFVFAAQMINFPVAGGTSGHLMGGMLTAALIGPSAAVVVLSCVLIVQCFLFADGGVTALGANIFNMALVGGVGSWAIYSVWRRVIKGLFGRIMAATFAAWCGTVLSSIACAGELAASHTVAWNIALPAMAGVHMLIGIGEGLVTALVLAAVASHRPELIVDEQAIDAPPRSYFAVAAYAVILAIGLSICVAPFASSLPDGLERVAISLGFAERSVTLVNAPLPDYQGGHSSFAMIGTSIAGAIGTIVVLGLAWIIARVLVPRAGRADSPSP